MGFLQLEALLLHICLDNKNTINYSQDYIFYLFKLDIVRVPIGKNFTKTPSTEKSTFHIV